MKPIIGVLPLWDDEKDSLWMLPGYFNGILRAGGVPVMLPLSSDSSVIEQAIQMCDGFMFTADMMCRLSYTVLRVSTPMLFAAKSVMRWNVRL